MEYLPNYDIVRVPLHYKGAVLHPGAVSSASLPCFANGTSPPVANPAKGLFQWSIPSEIQRLLEAGRALMTVTNVWSGVFSETNIDWDHESVALYANLSQPYGYDTRNASKPLLVWSGPGFNHSGNTFYLNYQTDNLVSGSTVQVVAPLPATLTLQFSSIETAPAYGGGDNATATGRHVSFLTAAGESVSVHVDLTFVVPRQAKQGGVLPIL